MLSSHGHSLTGVLLIGSAPEPTEVLTERRLAKMANGIAPPPLGRSPMKTSLGATPRRHPSVGPNSSPRRSQTPNRAFIPPTNRLLDFGMNEPRRSVDASPHRLHSRIIGIASQARRDVYDIDESPEISNGVGDGGIEADEDDPAIEINEESLGPQLGGDDTMDVISGPSTGRSHAEELSTTTQKKRGRKPRNSTASATSHVDTPEIAATNGEMRKTRQQKRKSDSSAIVDTGVTEPNTRDDIPTDPPAPKPTRGRPPKHKIATLPADGNPSPKRLKSSKAIKSPAEGKSQSRREALTGKDTNTKAQGRPKKTSSDNQSTSKLYHKPGILNGVQRIREETPWEDGATRTISGRVSFKPLGYWKGERAVYKTEDHLETIQSIIRVEDVTPVKRSHAQHQPRRKKRNHTIYKEVKDNDEEEPWELNEGVVSGPVREWDNKLGMSVDEERDAGKNKSKTLCASYSVTDSPCSELAFAAAKIEIRDVPLAKFRFAKTLTMPFFGSGMVELPPGGEKRLKNSRKMQMVFFVHYGKVLVQVAGTKFVITKGGVWSVPRGQSEVSFLPLYTVAIQRAQIWSRDFLLYRDFARNWLYFDLRIFVPPRRWFIHSGTTADSRARRCPVCCVTSGTTFQSRVGLQSSELNLCGVYRQPKVIIWLT